MNSQKLIEKINSQLEKGILPLELDYSEKETYQIDLDKIKYQSFYKTFEYTESKFGHGFKYLPAYEQIIEANIPTLSPLQEMVLRKESA